jgi:hypothetical protein
MKDLNEYLTVTKKVTMIEILKDNWLEQTINKTKKKISIKHYLNIYLQSVSSDSEKEPKYPLYVRVIFNRQSIKVKSAINGAFSKTEFLSLKEDTLELLQREALTLTYFINSNFFDTMGHISKSSLPEKAFNYEFSINKLFENYSYEKLTIPYLLNKALIREIVNFASLNSLNSHIGFLFRNTESLNAFQFYQYLLSVDSKWKKFEESYNGIWFFTFHYKIFLNTNSKYASLGASLVDFEYLGFGDSINDFTKSIQLDYSAVDLKTILIEKQ